MKANHEVENSQNPEERRRFERVDIAHQAQVLVLDAKGRKTGVLRQLARGGFMMEPEKTYSEDSKIYSFTIHEPLEDIRVRVNARLRFSDQQYAGFEFVDLDPHSAVEIGMIIGKYYEHTKA
ncbi:MAG TPA: PilZ domain-containing protein [Candidatus Angelobacter sp.]|nr:PilZ domain-containing protein [Candidatus Angelobacter sp.]